MDANFKLIDYVNKKDMIAARLAALEEASKAKLKGTPGQKFLYSNWGYVLAGAMAERATGKSWEQLTRDEVFAPLKMASAAFGGTGTVGKIDQPWPHEGSGKPAESNGPEMDNLPVMGPAATIHMALNDWGKFVAEHLRSANGKGAKSTFPTYLKPETFATLRTAVGDNYALGWIVVRARGADTTRTPVLSHDGDNTMNYAHVWLDPDNDVAVLVVANQSSATRATHEVRTTLMKAWLARK